ncbi:class I SAM-dependent methyltransferase [Alphaproteobacteria bacterium]|nr:class I SAM-dependent methyltransferase [Alphaproteobacteria bacterium]
MNYIDFIGSTHKSTKRNYLERVNDHDKSICAEVACRFDYEYWDGERKYGFGGYRYDGRWKNVARKYIDYYNIKPGDSVLDIGCGKGFLLFEIYNLVPNLNIAGIDISTYAVNNAKEEIKEFIKVGTISEPLPWQDDSFDFVYSVNTLHNLYNYEIDTAIKEINRVSKNKSHITVESYRDEKEKVNLMYWQLTCRAFMTPSEWEWLFNYHCYKGDYGCIYFE